MTSCRHVINGTQKQYSKLWPQSYSHEFGLPEWILSNKAPGTEIIQYRSMT